MAITRENNHKEFFINNRYILICLLILIATFSVYWQSRNYEFVTFDDDLYVTENHIVQTGLTFKGLKWAFTGTHAGNWHPLTWLSHMLDVQLFGMKAGWHHLTNVFFHLSNVFLLFWVFMRMTGKLWQSGLVAALFAVHPLHVESVAWVSERKDVLSTFFWLLIMWSYARYAEHQLFKRYLLVLFFFTLGLMAKSMLVTLPFVLLLLDYWPLRRFHFSLSTESGKLLQRSNLGLVYEKIPMFVLAAAFSIITLLAQQADGAIGSFDLYPLNIRISNALVSYVGYIKKMIWPSEFAVLYPHPAIIPVWKVVGAGVLLAAISFISIKYIKKYPWFTVGWLWYIGTLVPVIGLVQIGAQAMADRYTYVPLIGLFIIVAWGTVCFISRRCFKKTGIAVIAAALFFLMTFSWFQLKYWKNSTALFERALDVTTDNYVAHNNLGLIFYNQGELDDAHDHFSEALRIKPFYAKANNNMGITLIRMNKIDDAIGFLKEALLLKPDNAEAYNNLGVAFYLKERVDEAIVFFKKALEIKPDHADAYNNLKKVLSAQKKIEKQLELNL
jgi:Tfp pilus assembly protein PilF